MAQDLLQGKDVAAISQPPDSEGVSPKVVVKPRHAGTLPKSFHCRYDGLPAHQKNALVEGLGPVAVNPSQKGLGGCHTEGHHPLLITLAGDFDSALPKVDVVKLDALQLPDAHAGITQEVHLRKHSCPAHCAWFNGGVNPSDLLL